MSVTANLAEDFLGGLGPGERFSIEEMYKRRPDIHRKTLRNRTAEMVDAGGLRRVGPGEYEVIDPAPSPLEARAVERVFRMQAGVRWTSFEVRAPDAAAAERMAAELLARALAAGDVEPAVRRQPPPA